METGKGSDRHFEEIALFESFGHVAISFAFDVTKAETRSAYRLVAFTNHLESLRNSAVEAGRTQKLLIDPVRSFLDDVTNGKPGVNGRPLLLLACAEPPDSPARRVTLVRPERWSYDYEGQCTYLAVPEERRRIEMLLRDSFCVFESGRIFYSLTLVQPSGGAPLDEYALLQLQQIALDPELAMADDFLVLEGPGEDERCDLLRFVNNRLERFDQASEAGGPNAVRDVLKKFGLIPPEAVLGGLGWKNLANLCIGIEDDALEQAATYSVARYDEHRKGAPPPKNAGVADLERQWELRSKDRERHHEEGNRIPRADLVIAGLATGVPDFPFQDESEVHDSTRVTAQAVEAVTYTHPNFMLEIARNWRSFREAEAALGHCPYLYLTWMVALHDQMTVTDMELMLENLIYDPEDDAVLPQWHEGKVRAEPLSDVMQLLDSASSGFGQKTKVQERNLSRRLDLFRKESIHRCGNMFRYPKEKEALNAVRDAMGINGRFDEVHMLLDRMENLVEDVSTVASAYSDRRTNRLLGAVAILGVFSLPAAVSDILDPWIATANHKGWIVAVVTLAIIVAILAFYLAPFTGSWKRKKPRR